MNRRQFLLRAAAAPLVLALGVKTVAMVRHYPLDALLQQLKRLPTERLTSTGQWNVSSILQHLAQSVRYSRLGYPQLKPAWFRYTLGSAALNLFSAYGSMQHPLAQVIPGAQTLNASMPSDVAMAELISEIEQFIAWQGDLAPHFAYGNLSKAQYYKAHYLHIHNHLTEIRLS